MIVRIATTLMLLIFAVNANAWEYGYAPYGKLKYQKDFTHFGYVNPDAPKGGHVNLDYIGGFDNINPFTLKGNKAPGLSYTYDTLLVASSDELNSYYGLLAESFEQNGKHLTFKLRDFAKWHDGTPITASDVKFTFETLQKHGSPSYKILLKEVGKVDVIDKHTVRMELLTPNDKMLIAAIGEIPIISEAFFKDKDFDKFDGIFLTSGIYKIKSFEDNKYITYERVDNYWAKDIPSMKGTYNFDTIKYNVFIETAVAIEALKAGSVDFREENVSKLWARSYSDTALKKSNLTKELMTHHNPAALQAYFINTRKPYLANRAIREALTLAYDFDWINKNLLYDLYKRNTSYYENSEFKSLSIPKGRELELLKSLKNVPKEVFAMEFVMPYTNATLEGNRKNIKKAKQVLLDYGYYYQGEDLIDPETKKPLELEIIYHYPGFERSLLSYADNLQKIGIKLNLKMVDFSQYTKRLKGKEFDMIIAAFNPSSIPGKLEQQIWHSDSDVEGGYNLSGVRDPNVDFLINKMLDTTDKDELKIYAAALDKILLWNYYSVPQLYSNNFRIIYRNIFVRPEIQPEYSIGFDTWWIKN